MTDEKDFQAEAADTIKSVILENMNGMKERSVERVMKTLHSQAPAYFETKKQLKSLFSTYVLEYKLLAFSFIGKDNEYAVARVKQETSKISGPEFQDNRVDMIQVFRKEGGTWKFWTQAVLGIEIL